MYKVVQLSAINFNMIANISPFGKKKKTKKKHILRRNKMYIKFLHIKHHFYDP
jgi:hypothetical protein